MLVQLLSRAVPHANPAAPPQAADLVSAISSLPSQYVPERVRRLSVVWLPLAFDAHRSEPYDVSKPRSFSSLLLPHLAKVWLLDVQHIEALLIPRSYTDGRQGDWIYLTNEDDWQAWLPCFLKHHQNSRQESLPLEVDIILRPPETTQTPDAALAAVTPATPPLGASTDEFVAESVADSEAQPQAVATYDDPEELVPEAAPHESHREAQPSFAPRPTSTGAAAAAAGLDLAAGILASLGGLARSVSQQAEQMRGAHAARQAHVSMSSQHCEGVVQPPFASASSQPQGERATHGSESAAETDAARRRTEDQAAAPYLLDGFSDELAAMRSARASNVPSQSATETAPRPRPSNRSLSRSHSRGRRTSLLSSTLSLLTVFLLLFTLLTPAASAHVKRSPQQHLCKCTCFSTNSTLVPLFAPADPAKPCLTCTRQFCLDQGLEICKGARIAPPDGDTGTGWEGEVWAKCFERDDYKDQSIILFYLVTVVGLLVVTALRGRVHVWVEVRSLYTPLRASLRHVSSEEKRSRLPPAHQT
ncbi:hypothetical protein ACQY0O_008092 [Thecaphora frezii]